MSGLIEQSLLSPAMTLISDLSPLQGGVNIENFTVHL